MKGKRTREREFAMIREPIETKMRGMDWILLDQLNQGPLLRPVMSSVPESIRSRTVGVWSLEGVEGVMASKAVKPLIRTEPFQKECSATGRFISRGVEVELNAFWTSTRLKNVPWSRWSYDSDGAQSNLFQCDFERGLCSTWLSHFGAVFFTCFFLWINTCKYVFLIVAACIEVDESRSTMQETPTASSPRSLAASKSREAAASWGQRGQGRQAMPGCRFPRNSCGKAWRSWGHQTYLHQPWSPANCHSPHKFKTSCKCGRVLNCIFELSSNDILMYLDDQVHISLQSKWSQNTWSDSRFPIPKIQPVASPLPELLPPKIFTNKPFFQIRMLQAFSRAW